MWFAGYVVAPVLFQLLERKTAGMVAGQIFTVTAYIGLVCCLVLLVSLVFIRTPAGEKFGNPRHWMLLVMIILILAGQFVLQPMMAELKETGLAEGSQAATDFGRLHGIASVVYLVNSILGLGLVIAGPRKDIKAVE